MHSLHNIYDLRVTLLDKKTWEYKDLYFHFYNSKIVTKWISDFIRLKMSDHFFRERSVIVSGNGVDLNRYFKIFNNHIDKINSIYDIKIPIYETYFQDTLNLLHRYYEDYGNRPDIIRSEELDNLFYKFNRLIHDLESKIKNQNNNLDMNILASFSPRIDYKLEDEDFESVLPMTIFGNLYLGYNTRGKGLFQTVTSLDEDLISSKDIRRQEYWSNEIFISLSPHTSPSGELLNYKRQWNNLGADKIFYYGNFSSNREGYVPLGEMIPEQKDKIFTFSKGIDPDFARFDSLHSIELVQYRKYRDLDNIIRLPVWKYPVKVQGPEIKEIVNDGSVRITWLLNNICNYACRYCPSVLHDGKNIKHDWDYLEPFVNHLNNFYSGKVINFSLTGGEPTLSPFFPIMIRKIYELGHRIGVTTNLSRTQRYIEENFIYLDYASCSFHPAYEIKNNTFLQYVEKLKTSSQITPTSCRIMMDPDFWDQTLEFIELVKELKYVKIQPVMIDPQYGYSSRIISEIKYNDRQLDWFSSFDFSAEFKLPENPLYRMKEKFSTAIFDNFSEIIVDPQIYINNGQTNFWSWQCAIGQESLFIDHNGDIQRANCGVTGKVGTLEKWQEIDWNSLKLPVSCTTLKCHCGSDVLISKKKVD